MDKASLISIAVTMGRVALFIGLGGLVLFIRAARDERSKRGRVLILFAYVIALHLVVGLSKERDGWPFTSYRLMHGRADDRFPLWRIGFFGVDRAGREWRIDPYAWESITDWQLQWWFYKRFDFLSAAEKSEVLRTIYGHAERQRAAAVRLHRLPYRSFLGPLSAPQLWMFPREQNVAPQPYRGIRVYYEEWTVPKRLAGQITGRLPMGEWMHP